MWNKKTQNGDGVLDVFDGLLCWILSLLCASVLYVTCQQLKLEFDIE